MILRRKTTLLLLLFIKSEQHFSRIHTKLRSVVVCPHWGLPTPLGKSQRHQPACIIYIYIYIYMYMHHTPIYVYAMYVYAIYAYAIYIYIYIYCVCVFCCSESPNRRQYLHSFIFQWRGKQCDFQSPFKRTFFLFGVTWNLFFILFTFKHWINLIT